MSDDGFTVKEILTEMRRENRESFSAINSHLSQLNGKVATHTSLISDLQKNDDEKLLRLAATESRQREIETKHVKLAMVYSVIVFFASLLAVYLFNKVFT
jgi:hypothetical protein